MGRAEKRGSGLETTEKDSLDFASGLTWPGWAKGGWDSALYPAATVARDALSDDRDRARASRAASPDKLRSKKSSVKTGGSFLFTETGGFGAASDRCLEM